MFRYRDGTIDWSKTIIASCMVVSALVIFACVFAIVRTVGCTQSPACRAERDFKWEQERISDDAKYQARLAELERTQ